ncbi:MAG: hypothetical protein ABSF53_24590 [Terracidiphilus sp.]
MKSDGPLILAVLLLAAGLTMIFTYGVGTAGFSAGYPLSAATLNMSIATNGPAAVGGMGLTLLGFLALIWALVCSVFGMFRWGDSEARLERAERRRLKEQERLDRLQRLHLE